MTQDTDRPESSTEQPSQAALNFREEDSAIASKLIRARRTSKVLASEGQQITYPHAEEQQMKEQVLQAIADGGFAPFHFDRCVEDIAEPWRFYMLQQSDCREIGRNLAHWFSDIRPGNKLSAMLNACGCLVLVTWLPQFGWAADADKKQIQIDEEHLAAAAAATQNLLLSLTAKNLRTYWSSGGFFRTAEMFDRLQIDKSEKLLSAIFVNPRDTNEAVEVLPGKHNSNRSQPDRWTRTINIMQ